MTGSFTGQTSLLVNGVHTIKKTGKTEMPVFRPGKFRSWQAREFNGNGQQSAERVILKNKNKEKRDQW